MSSMSLTRYCANTRAQDRRPSSAPKSAGWLLRARRGRAGDRWAMSRPWPRFYCGRSGARAPRRSGIAGRSIGYATAQLCTRTMRHGHSRDMIVAATVVAYWLGVGHDDRARAPACARTKRVGVMPEQRLERVMWTRLGAARRRVDRAALARALAAGPSVRPARISRALPWYATLRVAAALVGARVASPRPIKCWARMGKRLAHGGDRRARPAAHHRRPVRAHPPSDLCVLDPAHAVHDGRRAHAAHGCAAGRRTSRSWVLKAHNEERHLLASHGDAYAALRRAHRTLPSSYRISGSRSRFAHLR